MEFIVARQNGSQPSDQARFKLLDAQLGVLSSTALKIALGDDVVALPNGTTVVRVPAGATYTSPQFTLPVPLTAPAQITVALEIDSVYSNYGQPTQITLKGPRAQQAASTQQTSYAAELTSVTPPDSNGDQPIVISGRALWRGVDPLLPSALAANSPVIVYIEVDGFVRQQSLVTDISGAFSYSFVPGPTEKGGVYQVWASHPDITSPPDSPATFTIRRVTVSPQVMTYRSPRNYRQTLPVTVRTGKGTIVQNLRAELIGTLPEAVSFSTTPVVTILPDQTVALPLSVVGLAATPTSIDFGTLQFRVISDDGVGGEFLWATLSVNYQFTEAKPYLEATPNLLEIGVQPAQTASETFALKNTGYAALEGATISLISTNATPLPSWFRLQTAAALGTIEVGATKNVVISAAPPVDAVTVDTVYFAYLHVAGANGTPQDFPVNLTVSPSGQGDAVLKLVDPYYQLVTSGPNPSFNGVPNASVVLEKESSTGISTLTQSRQSDANGEVSFSDLPAGRYKLRINADKHEPYIARITIKPGVVYAEQIALVYNPVTVTWEVVPITFQDKYNIVLTSTFVTDVPLPVVVIEPGSITLPAKMCAGQVYNGEFRVTNHGLIDADNVQLPLPQSDEFFSYEFLGSFGDKIKAKQTVTVPYRVKCLKALPDACPETTAMLDHTTGPAGTYAGAARLLGSGGSQMGNAACGTYGISFGINYDYRCSNGIWVKTFAGFYFTVSFGNCAPATGGVGIRIDYWGGQGGYTQAPGSGGPGGGVASSTAPKSDECYPPTRQDPPPPPPGPLPPSPNPNPPKDPNRPNNPNPPDPPDPEPPCEPGTTPPCPTSDSCSPNPDFSNDKSGSWVNLVTRQFRDTAVDLSVAVPGGSVDVARDYHYRRWSFVMSDDLYAVMGENGANNNELMLKDAYYRRAYDAANIRGGTMPQLRPVSALPEGVYLLADVGPESITKLADGTFVWTNGNGGERRYDANGRLASGWYRGVLISSYVYDGAGHLNTITDRDGRTVMTFTYAGGNLTKVRDYTGGEVNYTYDSEGRLITFTDALGTTTTYSYDAWWHMTGKRIHVAGTLPADDHTEVIEYQVFATTDTPSAPPLRVAPRLYTLIYRNRGMISKVTHSTGESKTYAFQYNEGAKTFYAYTSTASGKVEEFLFDAYSNLISKSLNGEPVLKIEQDAHTRVTTRGQNQKTTSEFDDRSRLVRRIHPDGSIETFEYDDVLNAVKRHTDRTGLITDYTYDAQHNVLSLTEAVGTAFQRVASYEYYPGTRKLKFVTRPDGRHWQIDNLSVHDGSLFPTSIGANPQLSIYGIVNRLAQNLVRHLGAGSVTLA